MTLPRFLILFSAIGLLLAACGSSDGGESDQTGDAADEAATIVAATMEALTAEAPAATAALPPTSTSIPTPPPVEVPTETPPSPGQVEVNLNIGIGGVPPMLIVLHDLSTNRYYHAINEIGQYDVTITGVQPGTYVAYAHGVDNDYVGGYTACDVTKPDCSDHTLIPFEVIPGETVSGIAIGDWTAPPGSFPDPPSDLMPTAPPPVTVATTAPDATEAPEGSVTPDPNLGQVEVLISYPEEGYPAMQVIISDPISGRYYFANTLTGEQSAIFENVALGSYVAYAYGVGNDLSAGYTPCEAADCEDHTLTPFEVTAGETVTIELTDWYAPEGAFPDPPSGG